MGFALSWVAVKGKPTAEILSELQLRPTGARGMEGESAFVGAPAEDGWYLIVMDRAEHPLLQPEPLARLSAGCEVLTCSVEEHVMCFESSGWRNGQQLWRVRHDADKGIRHLEEEGTFPPQYASIRDRLMKEQEENERGDGDVDFVGEIPVALAKAFVGYKHDDRNPKFEESGFEVLESELPAKTSWLSRMFRKRSDG